MFRRRVYTKGSYIFFPRLGRQYDLRDAVWKIQLLGAVPGAYLEIRWNNGHSVKFELPSGYYLVTKRALDKTVPYTI